MMTNARHDSWTAQDDLTLATTVLDLMRVGDTQLTAFESAGEQLNRTAAACGFRWNSTLRKQYEKEIGQAKAERKSLKEKATQAKAERKSLKDRATVSVTKQNRSPAPDIYAGENLFGIVVQQISSLLEHVKNLEQTYTEMASRNRALEEQLLRLRASKPEQALSEDYQALIQILRRARENGILADHEEGSKFRMDANGNIEKIV